MATLLNDRNELLFSAASRVTGASVSISPGAATSLIVPRNATAPTPAAITLSASVTGYVTPAYVWSYRFGDTGAFTTLVATTNPITVTCDAAFLTAAGSNTLVQYRVQVSETTSNIGVNQSEFTLSIPILREGQNGVDAINSVQITLYRRTTTNVDPAVVTAGNSTYTFSSAQVVGQPTDWTQTIPSAASGPYLWTIQVLAAAVGTNYQFANTLWSAPVLYAQNGTNGTNGNNGTNTALVYAYKRTASAPTDNPGIVDYSFTTNSITTATLANSWQKTIPAGTDPLYVTVATASSTTSTDAIAALEWSSPVLLVQNGAPGTDGINTASIFLYARNNNSTTAPTLSSTGTAVYTFATGVLSGTIPSGWTQVLPVESAGSVIWVVQATASSNTATDNIVNTEWSTPQVLAQKGADGAPGAPGAPGASGTSVYAATVYLQSALLPDTPVATASSFNFSTNVLTPPTGWSITQPATTTTPTYACDFTFSGAPGATVTGSGNWSTPYIEAVAGAPGAPGAPGTNGEYRDRIQLYFTSATAPTEPTSIPYTFSSNTIGTQTGGTDGWSLTRPTATTTPTYVTTALAATTTPAIAVTLTSWSTPVIAAQTGTNGDPGANTALVYAYKRSVSAPTDNPGIVDYSFTNNSITASTLANSWQKTMPAGTNPLYVTVATASSTTSTDNILAAEWTTPVLLSQNGLSSATVYIYARNNSSGAAPALATTGSVVYTYSGGTLSGTIPSGWTATIPAESNGSVIWVSQATASSTAGTGTGTISNTQWSTARVLTQRGSTGTTGTRGSRQLFSNSTSYSSTYTLEPNTAGADSFAVKATQLIAAAAAGTIPTTPIEGDTVTFTNGTTYVYTITYNSSTQVWQTPGTVIDGSLLVTGSVTAAKINTNGLSIRDTAGNLILSAGDNLANSSLSLPGTLANVPSGWLNSNVTLTSLGAASSTSVDSKLAKDSADALSATISINAVTGAGFRAGNLTWDDTGARTAGSGVALTPGGLVGFDSSGNNTFSINASTGAAIFSGSLNAATGSFSGSLNAASGSFTGSLSGANITGATGTFTGTLTAGTIDISQLVGVTNRYETVGTYYPVVPAGFTQMRVTLVGGGGGGGVGAYNGGGGGGGGGGLIVATYSVTPGQTITVQVGSGGSGGVGNYTNGTAGQNTTVDGYAAAGGGGFGGYQPIQTYLGPPGGAGGTGTVNGQAGQNGYTGEYGYGDYGGKGGNSGVNYGIGGEGSVGYPSASGIDGSIYGGGGGGGIYGGWMTPKGGDGARGLAIIEFYNPNGVIIRTEWAALISALQRQGIQTT